MIIRSPKTSKLDFLAAIAMISSQQSSKIASILVFRFKVKDIVFANGEKLCVSWLNGFTLSNAMIYASALAIVIFNAIILEILICTLSKSWLLVLSEFQRFHTHN